MREKTSKKIVEEYEPQKKKARMNKDIGNSTYLDEVISHFLMAVNKNPRKKPDHSDSGFLNSNTVTFSFLLMHEIQNRLVESTRKTVQAKIPVH